MSTLVNGNTFSDTVVINKQTGTIVSFDTDGKYVPKDIELTLNVQGGSATTPATSITANPVLSISGGVVTATVSASQSVTPTISSGFVSSGTAGTVSVSGSGTLQLDVASTAETLSYLGIS